MERTSGDDAKGWGRHEWWGSRDWAGSGGRARSPSAVAEVLAEWLQARRR